MKTFISLALLLSTLLIIQVLGGCVTLPQQPIIQNTITIDAPFDQVWTAVVSTIADISMPIESIEKDSGLITTKVVVFVSGYAVAGAIDQVAEKPNVVAGTWKHGRYSFNIFVSSIDENTTKIKINSQIDAYVELGTMIMSWYRCYSKGVIEKQIFDSIKAKL